MIKSPVNTAKNGQYLDTSTLSLLIISPLSNEISKKIKPKRKNWGNSPRKTLLRLECWEHNPQYSIVIGIFNSGL